MTVRILTDSTCDLPADIVAQLNISVLPLYIHVGNRSYLDGIDITRDDFYKNLPDYPVQPATAVPSQAKFRAMYDALADEGASAVISIHISKSLSATNDVAQIAAQETSSVPVTVFDSRQLSLGTGFLVETAARMALAGGSITEILAALNEQILRTHTCAALNTLTFLQRSGRMNAVMSTIGEILQIKPLLKMYDGTPSNERVRTRRHALKRLVQLLHEFSPFEKIAFLHSGAVDEARALIEEIKVLLPPGELWLEQINPVLGAHIGPGVVGFACISSRQRSETA